MNYYIKKKICKAFVRPHLEHGEILYDESNNKNLYQKIEIIQYNAALSITVGIRGTSQMKRYKELGFAPLKFRQ